MSELIIHMIDNISTFRVQPQTNIIILEWNQNPERYPCTLTLINASLFSKFSD